MKVLLIYLSLCISTSALSAVLDECAEYLMTDVGLYYQQLIKHKSSLSLSDVEMTEQSAAKRLQEVLPAGSYYKSNGVYFVKEDWLPNLSEIQRNTFSEYQAIRSGKQRSLRFLNRDTLVLKEFMDHVLKKDVKVTINESELAVEVMGDLEKLDSFQLKLLYEFQKSLDEVRKTPMNYRKIFDAFTGRLDIARASLGIRGKMVPKSFKDFFALHGYKNKLSGNSMPGWKMKNLDDSAFVIPGGKRTSYRGPDGIVVIENHNARGVLESVEVIVERSSSDPEQGVAFFAYKIGNKEEVGELAESNITHFKGKETENQVNTTNGCISCHKLLDKRDFSRSASSVHPFAAKAVVHDAIAEDMVPSSRKLQELRPDSTPE